MPNPGVHPTTTYLEPMPGRTGNPPPKALSRQSDFKAPGSFRWPFRYWMVIPLLVLGFFLYEAREITLHVDDSYFYDEGVYLYASKLMAEGYVPYKDFALLHPPGVEVLGAFGFKIMGLNILGFRLLHLALVLSSVAPLYGIARKISQRRDIALLTIFLFLFSTQLALRYFREMMLETSMLPLLVGAIYLFLIGTPRARFIAGTLVAAAALIKLTAILILAIMVMSDLWNRKPFRQIVYLVAGNASILVPALLYLSTIPGFLDNVFFSQAARYRVSLGYRMREFLTGAANDPLTFILGSLSVLWLAVLRQKEYRFLLLWAGFLPVVLTIGFNSFFIGYLVPIIPGLALAAAILVSAVINQFNRRATKAAFTSLLLLSAVVPLVVLSHAKNTDSKIVGSSYVQVGLNWDYVDGHPQVIEELKSSSGFLFTFQPIYGLYAERDIYPWYYGTDLSAGLMANVDSNELNKAIAGSDTVLLPQYPWFIDNFPKDSLIYIRSQFGTTYKDGYFEILERKDGERKQPQS